jgi:hypothetical protein
MAVAVVGVVCRQVVVVAVVVAAVETVVAVPVVPADRQDVEEEDTLNHRRFDHRYNNKTKTKTKMIAKLPALRLCWIRILNSRHRRRHPLRRRRRFKHKHKHKHNRRCRRKTHAQYSLRHPFRLQ